MAPHHLGQGEGLLKSGREECSGDVVVPGEPLTIAERPEDSQAQGRGTQDFGGEAAHALLSRGGAAVEIEQTQTAPDRSD